MAKDFEFALADQELGGEHTWYGKEDQTEYRSIHDKGKGEPIVMRFFTYKFRPDLETKPTREELLTPAYLKEIDTQLWGDALRRVAEPRLDIKKDGCVVGVPCVATTGNSHLDAPKLLQEYL